MYDTHGRKLRNRNSGMQSVVTAALLNRILVVSDNSSVCRMPGSAWSYVRTRLCHKPLVPSSQAAAAARCSRRHAAAAASSTASNSIPTAAQSLITAIMSFPSSGGGAGRSADAKSTGPKPPGALQRARAAIVQRVIFCRRKTVRHGLQLRTHG